MSDNTQQQQKPAKRDQLLENNMGLSPVAAVYRFPSTVIENTLTLWLESKGIDVDNIIIRAILKDEWRDSSTLEKASRNTNLPFLVVLFKQLVNEEDYDNKGGLRSDVMKNLRLGLNNIRDFSQFHMKQSSPLNKVLSDFSGRSVDWTVQKKARRAYTVLDSDAVMALCFKLPKNEITNYQFDFLEKPHSRINPETRHKEFMFNVAFSRVRAKRRPVQDPMNDIR